MPNKGTGQKLEGGGGGAGAERELVSKSYATIKRGTAKIYIGVLTVSRHF